MKNKSVIVIPVIIIVLIAVIVFIVRPIYELNKFEDYGKDELITYLQNITDEELKKQEVDKALNDGDITEDEANRILE